MSAQNAAWQAAFTAECAALEHLDHVQSLLDLVKAFETVPHAILAALAHDLGFPMALLRLSLAAYRLARSVGIDGAYSKLIVATRGITAGAGFATVELEVLLYDTMAHMHLTWAGVLVIKIYIDDITLAACGVPAKVIRTMVLALDYLVDQLERVLCMQVSGLKSKVLAGRPSVAEAVILAIQQDTLSVARRSKLLGTDTNGGRRRSTVTFHERVDAFADRAPRIQALRRTGVNSVQMVRSAGTPAVMYGCEIFGLSDSALYLARSKIANAASAPGAGKNVELQLHLLDGQSGTLDPAFDAHANPVLLWCMAIWHAWFTVQQMATAFTQASLKLARGKSDSGWNLVTGPVTTLLASLQRIGWSMPCHTEMIDDLGTSWSLTSVSPGAVAAACRESVRRWRLLCIAKALPGLVPDSCDVGDPRCKDTILVDFSFAMQPFVRGDGVGSREATDWHPAWKDSLVSAAIGGQWTQTRKASVPAFGISDTRCQLCLDEPGTTEHRFHCTKIMPACGWGEKPAKASLVLARLSETRKTYLRHRGLLVLRLPAPPISFEGTFTWLKQPSELVTTEACWHFDGSMLDGKWKPYRSTGFGIVVTSPDGDLLAYGRGQPPHWCKTAAAAEAWALCKVLHSTAFLPGCRTDCLSLIATAAGGVSRATDSRKVLAQIWVMVCNALDGELHRLADNSALVWIPAHTSPAAIGEAKRSDGARLSHIDWRANRLADGLAKQAAASTQAPAAVIRLLVSAFAAVRHAAKLLGRVTHLANHYTVEVVADDGTVTTKTVRDSADKPKVQQPPRVVGPKPLPVPSPERPARVVAPWKPPCHRGNSSGAALAHQKRVREEEEQHLQRRIAEVGALQQASSSNSATERLAALRARVLARTEDLPSSGRE